jgi:hypothetical protein
VDQKIQLLIQTFGEHRIKLNESLANHVFSKLGGPADAFFIATSQKELKDILDASFELKLPFFVLGSGTKTFISSQGFKGLVIKNRTSNLKIGAVKGKVGRTGIGVEEAAVEVDSGVSLGKLNDFLVGQNLQRIENISPNATVGGTLWVTPSLIEHTQQVIVWEKGETIEISVQDLNRNEQVILSAILKVKVAS